MYKQACELFDVDALPMSLNRVIAFTVTGNMNQIGQTLYHDDIIENPNRMIKVMEKSFYNNKSFWHSLFKHTEIAAQPDRYGAPQTLHGVRSDCNDDHYRTHRSYIKYRCWYHDQGDCRFGNACWNEHVNP